MMIKNARHTRILLSTVAAAALAAAMPVAADAQVVEASNVTSGSWTDPIWDFDPDVGVDFPNNQAQTTFNVKLARDVVLGEYDTDPVFIALNNLFSTEATLGATLAVRPNATLSVAGKFGREPSGTVSLLETLIEGKVFADEFFVAYAGIQGLVNARTFESDGLNLGLGGSLAVTAFSSRGQLSFLGGSLLVTGDGTHSGRVFFESGVIQARNFEIYNTEEAIIRRNGGIINITENFTLAGDTGVWLGGPVTVGGNFTMPLATNVFRAEEVTVGNNLDWRSYELVFSETTVNNNAYLDAVDLLIEGNFTVGKDLTLRGPGTEITEEGFSQIIRDASVTVNNDATIADTIVTIDADSAMTVGNTFTLNNSTLILEGRLTAGTVRLNDGTIEGDLTLAGGISRLEGNGTIDGSLTLQGGTMSPGLSIGTLSVLNDLIVQDGVLEIEIDVTDTTFVVDLIEVLGTASLTGFDLLLEFVGKGLLAAGTEIEFLVAGQLDAFMPDSIQILGLKQGAFRFDTDFGQDGNISLIAITALKVPEPATLLLLALGLAGAGVATRRRAL